MCPFCEGTISYRNKVTSWSRIFIFYFSFEIVCKLAIIEFESLGNLGFKGVVGMRKILDYLGFMFLVEWPFGCIG